MDSDRKIKLLREQIDRLDQQIRDLINQRAKLAIEIGEQKSNDKVFHCPEREAQVRRRISEGNEGPLQDAQLEEIFQSIMSACLDLQISLERKNRGSQ